MEKCEYLTGKDSGYKPGVVEQAKLEYSLLGKVFNKGLKKEGKKERFFKRIKNVEDKNEKLLGVKKIKERRKESVRYKFSTQNDL